ncbi:MAG: DUF2779 domain-containing protein [Spirosomataceae bacterium]|jgi:hypothetical protein
MKRLLTKSKFKLGLECPNKLFYTGKQNYANQKSEDPFLLALAEGGFQVEEYARIHFPGGVMIESDYSNYDYELYHEKTSKLLELENVIIYEAAFHFENLFIRTDILVKKGNRIYLKEVKAKSWGEEDTLIGTKGGINAKFREYLWDLAFQTYVVRKCFPEFEVIPQFVFVDKTKTASINGMNQMFRIKKGTDARAEIIKLETDIKKLGNSVLVEPENVNVAVQGILSGKFQTLETKTFDESLELLRENYQKDIFSNWPINYSACKKCEFKTTNEDKIKNLDSGFENCFSVLCNWKENDFSKPNIFDINNGHLLKLVEKSKLFKKDIIISDVIKTDKPSKTSIRQWIQIEKENNEDKTPDFDKEGLKNEISKIKYPLHFIDFETATVALPFYAGRKPYEAIAFQFSHHVMYPDGTVEHEDQYINIEKGVFPNFDFVRKLKKALSKDDGTIFRFHNHENTILNKIRIQLEESSEKDKDDLIEFILSITQQKLKEKYVHLGKRNMVDLWIWLTKYYYNPLTKGSNSLKDYLPASILTSHFLQEKYSKPISQINVSSLNFDNNKIWLNENLDDPYKQLEPVHPEYDNEILDEFVGDQDEIKEGGLL